MRDKIAANDWRALCESASQETDTLQLLDVVAKIERALDECNRRYRAEGAAIRIARVVPASGTPQQCDGDLRGVEPTLIAE